MKMTPQEAVERLKLLALSGDPEIAHGDADDILLEVVPKEVKETYEYLRKHVGFWYA